MAKALSTYRAKRDFTRTQEPSGDRTVKPAERLRFVIQKHRRRGSTKTFGWSSTACSNHGPSPKDPLDPRTRRLAVEDHPLD